MNILLHILDTNFIKSDADIRSQRVSTEELHRRQQVSLWSKRGGVKRRHYGGKG